MSRARSDRSRYKDVRENAWMTQVIDTLHLHGWVVSHFSTALTRDGNYVTPVQADGKGFPDLIAVHPKTGDVLVAELKHEYKQATPEQLRWLAWFEAAGVDAFVWRPSMVDAVNARIAEPRKRQRRAWDDGVLRPVEERDA